MRRLLILAVAAAVAGAAFAAWRVAARSRGTAGAEPAASAARPKPKPKLPPLPAQVRRRGHWIIGVKCDAPPFGYVDIRGENAGFDIDIARAFARFAFGRANRVRFECAPTAAR